MKAKKTAELRSEHPGTPETWVSELEFHQGKARKIVVRMARAKGAFTHVGSFSLCWDTEGDCFGRFYADGDGTADSVDLHLSDRVTARAVVNHIWAVLCEAGLEYAAKNDLSVIRGQFEIQDDANSPLNDPDLENKHLHLSDPARPWTGDDDTLSRGEASAYGQLRFALTENRRLATALKNHQERDEERAEARFAHEKRMSEQSMSVSNSMIAFATWKEQQIALGLEEMRGEARVDFITEGLMDEIRPRIGSIVEAGNIWLRTGGGRRSDKLRVPDLPADIQLWVLSFFGVEQFAAFSGELLKAGQLAPDNDAYKIRWREVLGVLDSSLESVTLTKLLAKQVEAWAKAAVDALDIDPYTYPRICFVVGKDPEEDAEADAEKVKDTSAEK